MPYRSGLEMHTIIRCTIYLNEEITKTNKRTKNNNNLLKDRGVNLYSHKTALTSMTGNTLFRLLPMKNRKKIITNRYFVKQALARDFGSYFTTGQL